MNNQDQKPSITLAQWCAYLPYGVEVAHKKEFMPKGAELSYPNFTLDKHNLPYLSDYPERFKPLLRPMNKENKAAINSICNKYELTFDGAFWKKYKPINNNGNFSSVIAEKSELPYGLIQELYAAHYDLDNLIPQGLALPIE